MITVELAPGLSVSRLGYGCASLMARTGHKESARLLGMALESGITHFDVARAYGYGEAEAAVGRFAAGRRDQVTITTKLGIDPPRRSAGLRVAKTVAKGVTTLSPRLRRSVRERASGLVATGRFDAAHARASVDQSLHELRSDYLDLLLLHDACADDLSGDLHGFMRECLTSGRARAVGVASTREHAAGVIRADELYAAVAQVPDALLDCLTPSPVPGARGLITHSYLAEPLAALASHLADATVRRSWSDRLDADLLDPRALARLLLASALHRNPGGAVLASSRNECHIRDNAAVASTSPDPRRLAAFAALLSEASAARPVRVDARAGVPTAR